MTEHDDSLPIKMTKRRIVSLERKYGKTAQHTFFFSSLILIKRFAVIALENHFENEDLFFIDLTEDLRLEKCVMVHHRHQKYELALVKVQFSLSNVIKNEFIMTTRYCAECRVWTKKCKTAFTKLGPNFNFFLQFEARNSRRMSF